MRGRFGSERTRETRLEDSRRFMARGRSSGSEQTSSRSPERGPAERTTRYSRRREPLWYRERSYRLRTSELEAMAEIGKFRMIDLEDLTEFHYRGNRSRAEQDLRNLVEQKLVRRIPILSPSGSRREVLVLTRTGHRLLTRSDEKPNGLGEQKIYFGFVKPAEAFHETAIYRMYQIEADKIRAQGGRIRRVVLDYELKEKVFRPLAKSQQMREAPFHEKQQEIAERHDLPVIEGKIAFPDLRIEYETREGERSKIDLEVITEHYRPAGMAVKLQTGFKIYFASTKTGGSSVKEEREITAGILSL